MLSNNLIDLLEPRRLLSGSIVADFNGIYPTDAVTLNGISYFAADDGVHGSELWKSDGTAAGTKMVRDICSGPIGSAPYDLSVVNGKLIFYARSAGPSYAMRDLYVSDGTAEGTAMLVALSKTQSQPEEAYVFNGKFVFPTTTDGDVDFWASDGTVEGTTTFKHFDYGNMRSDNWSGFAYHSYQFNGRIIYDFNGGHILSTDGTTDGTFELTDGGVAYVSDNMAMANGKMYYLEFIGHWWSNSSYGLWETDGTADGTRLVKQLPGGYGEYEATIVTAGDRLYMHRTIPLSQTTYEDWLWTSDGTSEGTVAAGKLYKSFSMESSFAYGNGRILIPQTNYSHPEVGTQLLVSDGAPKTSLPVEVTLPGWIGDGITIDQRAFFLVSPSDGGYCQLWRSDGTKAGTVKIRDLDYKAYDFYQFKEVNGKLLFTSIQQSFTLDPKTLDAPVTSAQNKITLTDGILRIFGTGNADHIKLWDKVGDPTKFVVDLNSVKRAFALSDVQRIYIYGYGGDDNIAVMERYGRFTVRMGVWAGDGDDTVYTGSGRDTINGQDGDDRIFGWNNNDTISGGTGDDTILGCNGNDTISGDAGIDSIRGNSGEDLLSGGNDQSKDYLDGGDGSDVLFGQAVYDVFFADKPSAGEVVDDVLQS